MNTTPIPDVIIDNHLTTAKPEYIAVCLYIFRWRKDNKSGDPTVERIKEALGCSGETVAEALAYWAGAGFDFAGKPQGKGDVPRVESRPSYPVADIEKASADTDDVRYMFKMAERIFGKALSYNDMNLLMSFYDWLALPVPVIEVLLDYCVSNNKKNSRYLESVALDWADNGITSVDEAEAYIKTFNTDYREIMKAMGHTRRDPSPKEIAFIRKWLRDYGMPVALVVEACGRTVIQTGGTSIKYTDSILTNWHNKGISTLEEADAEEQEFKDTKKRTAKDSKKSNKTNQKSKYANYKGRDWNFAELKRLSDEYAEKTAED
jgi:DnaD/phage-associated family protein